MHQRGPCFLVPTTSLLICVSWDAASSVVGPVSLRIHISTTVFQSDVDVQLYKQVNVPVLVDHKSKFRDVPPEPRTARTLRSSKKGIQCRQCTRCT